MHAWTEGVPVSSVLDNFRTVVLLRLGTAESAAGTQLYPPVLGHRASSGVLTRLCERRQVIFTVAAVLGGVACLSSLLLLWACLD